MFYPETLPAEKRSVEDSRRAVDRLMEYDRKLSEDFTVEELRKLFLTDDSWCRPAPKNYFALTDAEKPVVAALGFNPPEAPGDVLPLPDDGRFVRNLFEKAVERQAEEVADQRRRMKAALINTPDIPAVVDFMPPLAQEPEDASAKRMLRVLRTEIRSPWERNGKIYVWLDSMRYGNSDKKGFYYVRCHNSMYCVGPFGIGVTSGYGHPVLIVQKNKLRPDQVEYMECKCRATRETKDPVIGWC